MSQENTSHVEISQNKLAQPLIPEVLQEYVNLEKSIHNLERRNVLKKYDTKMSFADELKKNLDQMEANYRELHKQVKKKKLDLQNIQQLSVREFLAEQTAWQQRVERERHDYEEICRKQEFAEKELQTKRAQYERAAKIAEIYKRQCDSLQLLYKRQNEIISNIFGAENVQSREAQMRTELLEACDWQQRIALAKFKWMNGRLLLVHAVTQLAFGLSRWKLLEQIPTINIRARYFAAVEARNNINAASQNVESCRVYLEEEMSLLNTALESAFQDIQSNIALRKALTTYEATYHKVTSLLHWFDKVINDTILKDLDKANTDVARRQRHLREECLERLRRKARADLGDEMEIVYDDTVIVEENVTDDELLAMELAHEQISTSEKKLEETVNVKVKKNEVSAKLAAVPNRAVLFGDIQRKMLDNEDARRKFQRRDDEVRSRLTSSLQAKLRQRLEEARKCTSMIAPFGTKAEMAIQNRIDAATQFSSSTDTSSMESSFSIMESSSSNYVPFRDKTRLNWSIDSI